MIKHEILGHGHGQHTSGIVAIFRDHADSRSGHRAGASGRDSHTVDFDGTRRESEQTRQQFADLELTVSLHSGNPHDFTGVGVEIESTERWGPAGEKFEIHGITRHDRAVPLRHAAHLHADRTARVVVMGIELSTPREESKFNAEGDRLEAVRLLL